MTVDKYSDEMCKSKYTINDVGHEVGWQSYDNDCRLSCCPCNAELLSIVPEIQNIRIQLISGLPIIACH